MPHLIFSVRRSSSNDMAPYTHTPIPSNTRVVGGPVTLSFCACSYFHREHLGYAHVTTSAVVIQPKTFVWLPKLLVLATSQSSKGPLALVRERYDRFHSRSKTNLDNSTISFSSFAITASWTSIEVSSFASVTCGGEILSCWGLLL